MSKRHPPRVQLSRDIFGPWVGIVALLASKTEPLSQRERDQLYTRVDRAYADMATSAEPKTGSWRDLADAVNFLQSMKELEWLEDEGDVIEQAKAALYEAHTNFLGERAKLRVSGTGLKQLQQCQGRFEEVVAAMSAHSYWKAVHHARTRIERILRGVKKPGDRVISL